MTYDANSKELLSSRWPRIGTIIYIPGRLLYQNGKETNWTDLDRDSKYERVWASFKTQVVSIDLSMSLNKIDPVSLVAEVINGKPGERYHVDLIPYVDENGVNGRDDYFYTEKECVDWCLEWNHHESNQTGEWIGW